jgi:Lon protease-like protein
VAANSIPLFPLGTVLFPGVVLPLHIFEPRYRTLVRDLMAADDPGGREFGIVAIRQGWEVGVDGVRALHRVGCTAELRQVTPYGDGRFDIVSIGRRRFRLTDVDAATEPYLRGSVDWLSDEPEDGGEQELLARSVGELFLTCRRLLSAIQSPEEKPHELPDTPQLVANLVAAAAPLTLDDRQSLLAAPTVTAQLRLELRLLKREVTMLTRLRAVPVPLADLRVPMGPN